jgi:hypothetical protein
MIMFRRFGIVAVLASAVITLAVQGDDKKEGKSGSALKGTWEKKDSEMQLEFRDKDVMKIFPHGQNIEIAIVCKATMEKKGLVKATISEFEGKEEIVKQIKELAPVGLGFTFKWQIKDGRATLGDVTGEKSEALKSHLEGDYELKK